MHDVDVSGWQPDWLPASTQLSRHAERLRGLCGHQLTGAWIVWDLEHDTWFPDLPVVLRFDDDRQLDVCWQKFDDLSLTWNTIDVGVVPNAWVSWPLHWRAGAHPVLADVVGHVIDTVLVTEHLFTTRQVFPPSATGDPHSVWLVSGLWLGTPQAGMHIFNALDENGLSAEYPQSGPQLRRRPI